MTLDAMIHPCSQFMRDFVHGLFVKGVFQMVVHLLLSSLEEVEVHLILGGATGIYHTLHQFVKPWRFPTQLDHSGVEAVFDPKRRKGNKPEEIFKCEASEGLSVDQLLRFWVLVFVPPHGYCQAACEAFLAFCDIGDCMVTMACRTITPALLRQAVEHFLDLFTKAWATEPFTPKLHWLLHYSEELQAHGTLFSCFVHERKHKVRIRYGNPKPML